MASILSTATAASSEAAELAYTRDTGTDCKVWTAASDGSGATVVPGQTTPGNLGNCPRNVELSTDGQWLVYQRAANGIAVSKVDGTQRADVATGYGPSFVPGTTDIVFSSALVGDPDAQIYRLDFLHNTITPLVEMAGAQKNPEISPDGSRLVFDSPNPSTGKYEIYVANSDGSSPEPLDPAGENVGNASFSPDGSTLAYTNWFDYDLDKTLYTIRADGRYRRTLASAYSLSQPDWSEDGLSIAVRRATVLAGDEALVEFNLDGSGMRNLVAQSGVSITGNAFRAFSASRDAERVMLAQRFRPNLLLDRASHGVLLTSKRSCASRTQMGCRPTLSARNLRRRSSTPA